MQPFFSLILPCYNVAAYVQRCVHSIQEQDFEDYEIILVDDGATDGTPAICDALAQKDHRIRVIHKENGGASDARNTGLDAAQGRYIWFVDADDWIEEEALSILHGVCCDQAPDVVKFDYYRVETEKVCMHCSVQPGWYEHDMIDALRRSALCSAGRYALSACTHVYRRKLLEQAALRFMPVPVVGSEDHLFNLQLLLHVRTLRMIRQPLYNYERRPGSQSQVYQSQLAEQYRRLRKQLLEYDAAHQVRESHAALIERFFLWHLVIGSCMTHEYRMIIPGHTVRQARRNVRRLLQNRETKAATRRADCTGLSWKKRLQGFAVLLGFEPLFYWLYVVKPKWKAK